MAYALSTIGQGTAAYSAISANMGGVSTVAFRFGGRFEVESLAATTVLIANGSSSIPRILVDTSGRLTVWSSAPRIQSDIGSIVAGVQFEWAMANNITTGNWELYLNDMVTPVGTFSRGTAAFAMNQLPRSTSANAYGFKIYELWQSGGSFVDSWDETTATGAGTVWRSVGGARTLTMTNAAGAADSWWVFYDEGGSGATVTGGGPATMSIDMVGGGVASRFGGGVASFALDSAGGGVASRFGGGPATMPVDMVGGGTVIAGGGGPAIVDGGGPAEFGFDTVGGGVALRVGGGLVTIPIDMAGGGLAVRNGGASASFSFDSQGGGAVVRSGGGALELSIVMVGGGNVSGPGYRPVIRAPSVVVARVFRAAYTIQVQKRFRAEQCRL